ncbi:MAG: tetratricopeptide repeat protein [Pseudomonadota bacterium]
MTLLILSVFLLSGCGAAPRLPDNKTVASTGLRTGGNMDSNITLLPTLDYIPVLKIDKKGRPIPYRPAQNPYLKGSTRVSREATDAYQRAKQAFIIHDFEGAQQQLHYLLNNNARLSGPWVMLGDISLKQNALEQAAAHYLQAIAINKRNINAYLRLAKVQRMQGKFLRAQNTYAKSLAIWADFPEAHLNLGILYDLYLNDPVMAQKHIEAYQFLTGGKNTEVAAWLRDLQKRTAEVDGDQQVGKTIPIS